jgi:hypothetical protein
MHDRPPTIVNREESIVFMKIGACRSIAKCLAAAAISLGSLPALSQVTVHTSDFIADGSRSGFNGFETYTSEISYEPSHAEDGILVEHVGDFRDVWTVSNYFRQGFEGQHSWYVDHNTPIDTGYERITLSSGAAFDAIGLIAGSGFGGYCVYDCDEVATFLTFHYALLYQGVEVASGTLSHHPNGHYVGFSGGGFDEVRLWDSSQYGWPGQTALMLDSIEVIAASPVPEPSEWALMLVGLGVVGTAHRRRRARLQ